MAIPVIALVAAGLSVAGTGFSVAGSLKPYIDKATPLINNNEFGDWRTAGTVSGINAGINPELTYHRYKEENKKATTLRTIGGALTGLGGIVGSFSGMSGNKSGLNPAEQNSSNPGPRSSPTSGEAMKGAKDGLFVEDKKGDDLFIQSIKPIKGRSHRKGGVKLNVNDKLVEAEGGEFQIEFTNGDKAIFNKQQMLQLKSGKPLINIVKSLDVI